MRVELDAAEDLLATILEQPAHLACANIEALTSALHHCPDPARLRAIAGALPPRLGDASPELCTRLADLAWALRGYGPRLPEDRGERDPLTTVVWLRLELAASTESCAPTLERIDDPTLLRVLAQLGPGDLRDAGPLLARVGRAPDPRLRARLPTLAAAAVQDLALEPSEVFPLLAPALDDEHTALRRAAFASLGAAWVQPLTPIQVRARTAAIRRGLTSEDPAIGATCVELCHRFELPEALLEIVVDDAASPTVRARALAGLGASTGAGGLALTEIEALEYALTLAAEAPLRYAAATRECIVAAHRCGLFLQAAHIPAALAAFDAHRGWTGALFVRITHVARAAMVVQLDEFGILTPDDPRWIRRAAILGASAGAGAHVLIARQLRRCSDPAVALALIDAARRSPEFDDEGALLAWLERLPEEVLAALEVKAGPEAAIRLDTWVFDPDTPPDLRARAMVPLWSLSRARPALLERACAEFGPHHGGLFDPRYVGERDTLAAELYLEAPWAEDPGHEIEALRGLRLLCDAGELRFLPEVTRLFRSLFRNIVARALAGDFSVKRVELPALEQLVFRYGRHLVASGRRVRSWHEDSPATGRDLVLDLAVTWLLEGPSDPTMVALLESVGRHQPTEPVLRRIQHLWRHPNPGVQRAAIEAILAAGEGARGLELSLRSSRSGRPDRGGLPRTTAGADLRSSRPPGPRRALHPRPRPRRHALRRHARDPGARCPPTGPQRRLASAAQGRPQTPVAAGRARHVEARDPPRHRLPAALQPRTRLLPAGLPHAL